MSDEEIVEFWNRVNKTDGCWQWLGATSNGYGSVRFNGRMIGAHRLAWIISNGAIPKGLYVCHHCDNPPCVRPDHLFLGTHQQNVQDAFKKGRMRGIWGEGGERLFVFHGMPPGESHPRHKLTEQNVIEIRSTPNYRGITYALGRKFNVRPSLISQLRRGIGWKGVGV